jgi:acyl-CoA synthetase (AMP-forming)/AMP-acid ligase II
VGKPLGIQEVKPGPAVRWVRPERHPGYSAPGIGDAEGWFHTGDVGELDEKGHLRIRGRKDVIVTAEGEKRFPGDVEAARPGPGCAKPAS